MANPVWKDYFVNLGTPAIPGGPIYWRVYDGLNSATGTLIFYGVAYPRPGETNAVVRINDICADYLSQSLPELTAGQDFQIAPANVSRTFAVYVGPPSGEESAHAVVTFDLNYDFNPDIVQLAAVEPINDIVQDGMLVPCTIVSPVLSSVGGRIVTAYDSGHPGTTNSITEPSPFNVFVRAELGSGLKEDGMLVAARRNSGTPVPGASHTYTVRPRCHRWALYYVNELGGWDALLIEGRTRETSQYKRTSYTREHDNTTHQPAEVVIGNDITRTWELHTGYLTDAQAGRMHHLLGSNQVYLFDLTQDEKYYPVIITNADYPVKEYRADGMVSYQIDVKQANTMTRR